MTDRMTLQEATARLEWVRLERERLYRTHLGRAPSDPPKRRLRGSNMAHLWSKWPLQRSPEC